MENKVIKTIFPSKCPSCGQDILVCFSLIAPYIDWLLKPEDIKQAKEKVKSKILKVKFDNEEEKTKIVSWLDNPNTLFGPEEVDQTLYQLLNMDKKEEKKEKEPEKDIKKIIK